MCEYCDGSKKPIIDVDGDGFDGGVAKVVGAELHVNWGERLDRKGPMFVFGINNCPMCGRDLNARNLEYATAPVMRDPTEDAAFERGRFYERLQQQIMEGAC